MDSQDEIMKSELTKEQILKNSVEQREILQKRLERGEKIELEAIEKILKELEMKRENPSM